MSSRTSKKTKLMALSGIIAALSVVIMLVAYFPYFTYAMPAIAGAMLIVIVLEANKKSALLVYAVVSVLSFIICEKESALCYVLFFGYYAVLKSVFERIGSRVIEWIVKIIVFNIAFIGILLIATYLLGISSDVMNDFGAFTWPIFLISGNIMFITYDFCLTQVVAYYISKYQAKVRKMLN